MLSIVAAPGKKLTIQKALYGDLPDEDDNRPAGDVGPDLTVDTADVTLIVRKGVSNNTLSIVASNDALGGDPAPGIIKMLTVQYTVAGKSHRAGAREGATLVLPVDGDGKRRLVIVKATWGPD